MPSINKEALQTFMLKSDVDFFAKKIAEMRLEYSDISHLLTHFIAKLAFQDRICPRILPTQASGRWSYIDPPLTNFPKKCINPSCPAGRHRKTESCWSTRDCIIPDYGSFWLDFDLDAVEARIYALLLQWNSRIKEFNNNTDIHTPVTCQLFKLPFPVDLSDPHNSSIDEDWRKLVSWQGKDDKRRTMSKNFTYGGQYFYVEYAPNRTVRRPNKLYKGLLYNPSFVFSIPDITSYGLESQELLALADRFIETTYEIQLRKAEAMEKIRRNKIARTLYGFRRIFFKGDEHTAKEGWNHMHQGTVADYMNETCKLLDAKWPESYCVHQGHDSLKWAFPNKYKEEVLFNNMAEVKNLVERYLAFQDNEVKITATFKKVFPREV